MGSHSGWLGPPTVGNPEDVKHIFATGVALQPASTHSLPVSHCAEVATGSVSDGCVCGLSGGPAALQRRSLQVRDLPDPVGLLVGLLGSLASNGLCL